ncbi:MAG: hypothetical protein LC643_05340, partial [Bacteroidales bacterium]|nr:hypothetical protein [Bacteroidales bacterium]
MKKDITKTENITAKTTRKKVSNSTQFPIIGIGASAGGLEALEQFFHNVPKNCGIAFVVIQHLDPNREGIMPELLQRTTELKVLQVCDHMQVQANHMYVI